MSKNDHTDLCGDHNCEMCYSEEIPEKLSMSLLQRFQNHWNAVLRRSPTNSMGPQGTSNWSEDYENAKLIAAIDRYKARGYKDVWHVRLRRWLRNPFRGRDGNDGAPGPMGAMGMMGEPGRDNGLVQMYNLIIICELSLNETELAEVHRHALRFVLETGNWIEGITVKKTPADPNDTYGSDSHLEIRIDAKRAPTQVTTNVTYKDAYFGNVHNFN